MIPIEIEKWRFARKLYPDRDKQHARRHLNKEMNNSPALKERLSAIGYNPRSKLLRRAELLVIMDLWCLPDDFFDTHTD